MLVASGGEVGGMRFRRNVSLLSRSGKTYIIAEDERVDQRKRLEQKITHDDKRNQENVGLSVGNEKSQVVRGACQMSSLEMTLKKFRNAEILSSRRK